MVYRPKNKESVEYYKKQLLKFIKRRVKYVRRQHNRRARAAALAKAVTRGLSDENDKCRCEVCEVGQAEPELGSGNNSAHHEPGPATREIPPYRPAAELAALRPPVGPWSSDEPVPGPSGLSQAPVARLPSPPRNLPWLVHNSPWSVDIEPRQPIMEPRQPVMGPRRPIIDPRELVIEPQPEEVVPAPAEAEPAPAEEVPVHAELTPAPAYVLPAPADAEPAPPPVMPESFDARLFSALRNLSESCTDTLNALEVFVPNNSTPEYTALLQDSFKEISNVFEIISQRIDFMSHVSFYLGK